MRLVQIKKYLISIPRKIYFLMFSALIYYFLRVILLMILSAFGINFYIIPVIDFIFVLAILIVVALDKRDQILVVVTNVLILVMLIQIDTGTIKYAQQQTLLIAKNIFNIELTSTSYPNFITGMISCRVTTRVVANPVLDFYSKNSKKINDESSFISYQECM